MFVISTFALYLLIPILILWAIIEADDDRNISKLFVVALLVTLTVFSFSENVNPFTWIIENPISTVLIVVSYIGIGAIWSTFKWWLLSNRIAKDYEPNREKYKQEYEDYKANMVKQNYLPKEYKSWLESNHNIAIPVASKNKSKILAWMFWWPFSVANTFIGDFLYRVFVNIYNRLVGVYSAITNRIFGKFDELK